MTGNGIMQEIRTLLAQGRSSGEVIALGYKPPTVYKVQRQFYRRGQGDGSVAAPRNAQPQVTTGPQPWSEVEVENIRLRQEVKDLEADLETVADDATEFASQFRTLEEQVKASESQVAIAGQWRQRVQQLEGQLEQATHTEAAMQQDAAQWQGKFTMEQDARQRAEAQTATLRQESQGLRGELVEWQQIAAKTYEVFQTIEAEVKGLRPLAVWAGHPCMVCKQPMLGSVDRETAAKLMKDFRHKACQENQGPGLGGLLLAGGALAALAQLGKK